MAGTAPNPPRPNGNDKPAAGPVPPLRVRTVPLIQLKDTESGQAERFKIPTMAERVCARLKDEFGAINIRVRGPGK